MGQPQLFVRFEPSDAAAPPIDVSSRLTGVATVRAPLAYAPWRRSTARSAATGSLG